MTIEDFDGVFTIRSAENFEFSSFRVSNVLLHCTRNYSLPTIFVSVFYRDVFIKIFVEIDINHNKYNLKAG